MTPDAAQNGNAVYFDGRSNRKHYVALRFAAGVEIVEQGAVLAVWPYGDVRRADGPAGALRISCMTAPPLARLQVEDIALKEEIVARCTSLDAGRGSPQTGRIVFWSLAAVSSIVMLVLFVIPLVADRLAPFIPGAFERRLGQTVDKQARAIFGGRVCNSPAGQTALTVLVDKLTQAGGIDFPLEAYVLSSTTPNAFALPGGKIYLLNGLLQKADSADEIAGILAHELGHVKHRDHMRRLIQTGGTSFLIGLLFGDVTGAGAVVFAGRSLLDASYSREAEQNADAFAIDVMHKLGRSPMPMGALLFRVTGAQANRGYTILASHPLTEARLAAMKKADQGNSGSELLSAAQWRALEDICGPSRHDSGTGQDGSGEDEAR
ncbi:MAG: M48 family metallopeptidase [Pseudolabrys sp.]